MDDAFSHDVHSFFHFAAQGSSDILIQIHKAWIEFDVRYLAGALEFETTRRLIAEQLAALQELIQRVVAS
ncbi:hypothetical protein GFM13_03050 [Rhizobium leguminosarum bv. viciae]|nr:hypothetical protein [Rhizobium leguminosarum bv. viciae]